MSIARISNAFAKRNAENQAVFVAYLMAGDPDMATSRELLMGMPQVGVDVVELGMPFSDPIAEGPTIQLAAQRSLAAGTKMANVLELAADFRKAHPETPLILMGYANPVHHIGWREFARQAGRGGVDGAIIVDLPPEESSELESALADNDMALIRLVAPTTKGERLEKVLNGVSGFVYYVSITGVTGAAVPDTEKVRAAVSRIQDISELPVAVGFGVRDTETATAIAKAAEGVVVGSAIVSALQQHGVPAALDLVRELAKAAHQG